MTETNQPGALAGFGGLLRFVIRRDRVRGPVWFVALVGLIAASASSVISLYDTADQREVYARLVGAEDAFKAIAGPGHGLDDPTTGAIVMNEVLIYTFVGVALMAIFILIRHTREEEDTDRAELVRAAGIGRLAPLAAAVSWVLLLAMLISLGLWAALVGLGLPAAGAAAYALATFGVGAMFTAVAAVTAQIGSTARAARAGAGGLLAVSFLLRAVGDVSAGWVTWLSPLGWAQSIRAYADERWWVLGVLGLGAMGVLGAAVWLNARRDLGAGLLTQRPGPPHAAPSLRSPLGLAIRLQRTALLWWTVGAATMGFFFGIVADQADELLEDEAIAEFFAQSGAATPTDTFLATSVLMVGMIASGYTVSTVLRLRTEEQSGRAEPVLATPTSRRRWMGAQLIVATGGSVLVMTAAGVFIGLGHASQGAPARIGSVTAAAVVMVPALLVIGGLGAALLGISARRGPLAWVGVAGAAVVGFLAETLDLPDVVRGLSPFHHVPAMPAVAFEPLPVAVLLAVAATLGAGGLALFSRRDLAG